MNVPCRKHLMNILKGKSLSLFMCLLLLSCLLVSSEPLEKEMVVISLDDIEVPVDGTDSSRINICYAENIVIVAINVTWDPSVVYLDNIDTSMAPFDSIFDNINNDNGFLRLDAYEFSESGLDGNFTVCSLDFIPATGAVQGDWCYLNFSECMIWNYSMLDIVLVPSRTINGSAIINGAELDVSQSLFNRGYPVRHSADGEWGAAQSFKPTLQHLSNVSILLGKFGEPEFDLIVELRENAVDGTLIETMVFTPSQIPMGKHWLEVDINDIAVVPGNKYFIVLQSPPPYVKTSFGYEWAYAFGDQYPDGCFWFTRDGGSLWRDLPTMYDFTFKTFGYN